MSNATIEVTPNKATPNKATPNKATPTEAAPLAAPGTWEEVLPLLSGQTVVAGYRSHAEAEKAVYRLAGAGVTRDENSVVGRNFETREDVQGFYRPADAAWDGAESGACFGGLFGLLLGMGFFLIPVIGPVFVLGPSAGLVAGAIGGAGVGALINGLVALGIPQDQAPDPRSSRRVPRRGAWGVCRRNRTRLRDASGHRAGDAPDAHSFLE